MNPLEGLTSAVGETLTELQGYQQTRVTAPARAEAQVQSLVNSVDYDGATTLTLTSGTVGAGVAAGQRVRVLSGTGAGAEATVSSAPVGGTTVSLSGGLIIPGETSAISFFSGESLEVVTLPDATLSVESTDGFPSTRSFLIDGVEYLGRVVLDERVYYYATLTPTSFGGLAHDGGTGTLAQGVVQDHAPLAEVDDYSRATSALDVYRRGFLVNFATGEDLTVLGRNLGLDRPDALSDDDLYRELVKAAAYSPRGTVFAVESVLTALLGPGNFELFEDLTLASDAVARGATRNRATLFVAPAGATDQAENPFGKFWLDGYEEVLSGVDPSQLTVTPDDVLSVASVQAAPDTSELLVAEGSGAASADGVTVTFPALAIPAYVFPGDVLLITDGPRQSARATVRSRDTDAQLTLGSIVGFPNPSASADGSLGGAFSGSSWRVVREGNRWGYYLPEDERVLEGGSARTTWEQAAGGSPSVVAVPLDTVYGPHVFTLASTPVVYRRTVRVRPEDDFTLEVQLDVASGNAPDDVGGTVIAVNDGERVLTVSVAPTTAGTELWVGLSDPAVADDFLFPVGIWSGQAGSVLIPGNNTVWLEKRGRGEVVLYRSVEAGGANPSALARTLRTQREFVNSRPYADFPTLAQWTAAFGGAYAPSPTGEVLFGHLRTASPTTAFWRRANWSHTPRRDYWNRRLTSATAVGQSVVATGQMGPGVVGLGVAVTDFDGVAANGGSAKGSWEVVSATADVAQVVGARRGNGQYTLADAQRFTVGDGTFPFRWPDHANHAVEVLSGAAAGVYPILAVLDPETGAPYAPDPVGPAAGVSGDADVRVRETSNAVRLAGLAGAVGESDVQWRLVPNFPASGVTAEVVGEGAEAGGVLTLPAPLPFPAGTLMRVYSSRVPSGYLHDPTEGNNLLTATPLAYSLYPAYLYDPFGYVRDVVDILTVAGVIPDFESFFRDAAGPHVRS